MDYAAIITSLGTVFGTVLTVIYAFKKQKLEITTQNEILTKKIDETDKLQSEKIAALENLYSQLLEKVGSQGNEKIQIILEQIQKDIESLNELHKYTRFSKSLKREIENLTNDIIVVKKIDNEEMQRTLAYGVKKANSIFDEIIEKEFNFDIEKLKEQIIIALKAVKISITQKNLELSNSYQFLKDLKNNILLKNVENFLSKYLSVAKLENGIRRKEFEIIAKDLVCSIICETLDLYKNYDK